MPSNWLYMDTAFPRSTGEESDEEWRVNIENYLFLLVEQMRYTLQNLDLSNANPTAAAAWAETITEPLRLALVGEDGSLTEMTAEEGSLLARVAGAEGQMAAVSVQAEAVTARVAGVEDAFSELKVTVNGISGSVSDLETGMSTALKMDATGVYIVDQEGKSVTIQGSQLKAGTVTASKIDGAEIALTDGASYTVGTIKLAKNAEESYAFELNSNLGLRLLSNGLCNAYIGSNGKSGVGCYSNGYVGIHGGLYFTSPLCVGSGDPPTPAVAGQVYFKLKT